ncbi:MAG: ATP synthase F1 subunit delta [Clostridium sp.]|nr:ATP synthase F1 subunit delta [Clostridium sp.]
MMQIVNNYARVLYELGVKPDLVKETKHRYLLTDELPKVLDSPVISKKEKHRLIEQIFDEKLNHFLKVVSDYGSMNCLTQILDAYFTIYHEEHHILAATLYYVTKPSEQQTTRIISYLKRHYGENTVKLTLVEESELVGGFIIKVGNHEHDWSLRGRFKKLENRLNKQNKK